MLKRILILLGETRSSTCARSYALRLAHNFNAAVTGIAGVDPSYVNSTMPGAIGSIAQGEKLKKKLRTQADESRKRLFDVFQSECQAEKVSFDLVSFEGDPIESLCSAAETHDLIVAGHNITFRGEVREQPSDTVLTLLSLVSRPMIICPDEATSHNQILVAYDGNAAIFRAVQLFTLLELGGGKGFHVISIARDQNLANKEINTTATFLRSHDCRVDTCFALSGAKPVEAIKRQVAERDIGTLVMGAYGRRRLCNFLYGSATRALMQNPPCAMFIYR